MTVEELCRSLLIDRARECWRIMPVTVEESCEPLLNKRASDCWRVMPVTVGESCHWLLKNRACDCWTILPRLLHIILNCWTIVLVIAAHNFELLNNRASDSWKIMPATVGRTVPVTVDKSCQRLLNSRASCFFSLFLTYLPVFRVNTSIIIDYFNSGHDWVSFKTID